MHRPTRDPAPCAPHPAPPFPPNPNFPPASAIPETWREGARTGEPDQTPTMHPQPRPVPTPKPQRVNKLRDVCGIQRVIPGTSARCVSVRRCEEQSAPPAMQGACRVYFAILVRETPSCVRGVGGGEVRRRAANDGAKKATIASSRWTRPPPPPRLNALNRENAPPARKAAGGGGEGQARGGVGGGVP